jgi:hypothetical protein
MISMISMDKSMDGRSADIWADPFPSQIIMEQYTAHGRLDFPPTGKPLN